MEIAHISFQLGKTYGNCPVVLILSGDEEKLSEEALAVCQQVKETLLKADLENCTCMLYEEIVGAEETAGVLLSGNENQDMEEEILPTFNDKENNISGFLNPIKQALQTAKTRTNNLICIVCGASSFMFLKNHFSPTN